MGKLLKNARRKLARLIFSRNEDVEARLPHGFIEMGNFVQTDLFIIGFPKSGHTWTQNLVAEALYGFNMDEVTPGTLIHDLVPDIHFRQCYKRYRTPMFFKAHALPRPEFRKVVYLLRDGRDAMVSYHHYLEATKNRTIDFLNMVRTGEDLFPCKWHEHVRQWRANPHGTEILTVRYEDLKADTAGQVERILHFAGITRSRAQVETAVRRSSFKAMQKREKEFGMGNPEWPKDRLFVRRGEVGSYKDEMPVAIQEAFLAEAAPIMREVGYLPAAS
jgi:hypothetical protein